MPSTTRARAVAAVAAVLLAGLTGCGTSSPPPGTEPPAESFGEQDLVSGIREDPAISALVPAGIKESGTLRFGSGIGAPPIAFYGEDSKTPMGVDIDMSEAVARVLGMRIDRQKVSGEAILTGLLADRFQVATASFSVTEERKKVLDFVTYLRDGAGFVALKSSEQNEITELSQLCGLRVGTGKGSVHERRLNENKGICTEQGKPVFTILTYPDAAAQLLAVKEGRIDVLMNAASALGYMANTQQDLEFLGRYGLKDVGFGLKKGSPLAPALSAAVNKLIEDGVYAEIIDKWELGDAAAVPRSEVNPPERTP